MGNIISHLVTLISGLILGIGALFFADRFSDFLHLKENKRKTIEKGPQLNIKTIISEQWFSIRKDDFNYSLKLESNIDELNGKENYFLKCEKLCLKQQKAVNSEKALRIRVVNNTTSGVSVLFRYDSKPNLNTFQWEYQDIDPNTNISIYCEIAYRPDKIIIIYKGYELIYYLTKLTGSYINASDAQKIKSN